MIYAVIDTNVFVSAYLTHNFESATSKVVTYLLQGKITLLYNDEIMEEYEEVLSRSHFHISFSERETLFAYIREKGILTERTTFGDWFVDEDDRVFYEVALSEEDSFLVTGNLKHYPIDPRVVTPAQMLEILEKD
jgi:putative PIN family toxin of toxin-antitoxin system